MCGILGWVSLDGAPPPLDRLERSLPLLDHRGPDDRGSWSAGPCWLGQTRLSILDLSPKGRQPMSSPDGRYQITYNGEFYNYRDYIPLLKSKGYQLDSSGDTAVLLGLYTIFGSDALSHINGMFAVAIWDTQERRLFLARDRMGKKPLYYAIDGKRICFASELKALVPLLDKRSMNGTAVDAYFALGYVPAPMSIYSEVRKLEPATYLMLDSDQPQVKRYWNTVSPNSEDASEEEVESLLIDSIRQRLVSDVPVGVFLSGGIDSSLIAAIAAKRLQRPLQAFCMGAGPGFYDERPFASAVAQHSGIELVTGTVETSPRELLDRALASIDEPFSDSSFLPTFALCELASKHGKVALSGEGGDEIFGGYDKYQRFLTVQSFRRLPEPLRRLASRPGWSLNENKSSWLRSAVKLARYSLADDLNCFSAFNSQMSPHFRRSLFTNDFYQSFGKDNVEYFNPHADNGLPDFSLKRILAVDRRTYLAGDLLFKVDRMSMAHSLEVRCPFLDYRLVELSLRLPDKDLIHGSITKVLLRRLAAKYLPKEIADRPKKGFSVPISQWLRTDFSSIFQERVHPDSGLPDVFNYQEIQRRFELHQSGRADFGNHLWALLIFHLWWQRWCKDLRPVSA